MRRLMLPLCLLLLALATPGMCLDELRFYLHSDPKTFNPALVADPDSETIRYLTGGVLVRLNRQTQQLEPELATAWKVSKDGKTITFQLRQGVRFSDGTPFGAQDVQFTMTVLMDPMLHSPTGDAFRSGQDIGSDSHAQQNQPHVSSAGSRTGKAVRSGGHHVCQLAEEGNGRAGAVLCG